MKEISDKFDRLREIYGSWDAVAKALHKTHRQVRNYRNGYSQVSYELSFLIYHLVLIEKVAKVLDYDPKDLIVLDL